MKEDIKILENYLEDLDVMIAYDKDEKDINIKQAIEHLIARNKELEEEKEKAYKEGYIKGVQPQIFENWNNTQARMVKIESQTIPKFKIRELKENIHDLLDNNGIARGYQIEIDRLFEELLEEEV